jgi:chorismate mutase
MEHQKGRMSWQVRGVRGATTIEENTPEAIEEATIELISEMEIANAIDPVDIVSVIFSVTPDINAAFPARFARTRLGWEYVPLLDVQHMAVEDGLRQCIRVLMQVNTPLLQHQIQHVYLRRARVLRPDIESQRGLG